MLVPPANLSGSIFRIALPFMAIAWVTGCVGTRVEYYTEETYPGRDQAAPVEWLGDSPARPYMELARITVSSTSVGEDRLRSSLLERARRLGADAVISEPPLIIESAGPTPYYERGLLGPMGASFQLYGYGWYAPYSSNPYILVQGAVDQPRVDRSLSGVAIRYEDSSPVIAP